MLSSPPSASSGLPFFFLASPSSTPAPPPSTAASATRGLRPDPPVARRVRLGPRVPAQPSFSVAVDGARRRPQARYFTVELLPQRPRRLSEFFRKFLDFYELQPHHLLATPFLSFRFATFMEAYIGIRPTRETFARFFALRINSVQGKDIPKPKPPVQCGSCIIGSRQGSSFFKFSGLESCREWQGTFFYVKNNGPANLIDLPPFSAAPTSRANWSYNPKTNHIETNRVVRFMANLMKETNICSDDIIRTFISRRVLPLKRRQHRMSEMYGWRSPRSRPSSLQKDVVRKAKQICGCHAIGRNGASFLSSTTNPPTQEPRTASPPSSQSDAGFREACADSFDPDPYIGWKDLKMGKTQASRLGRSVPKPTGSSDDLTLIEIHEHVPPLREAGHEFVDKLMAQNEEQERAASMRFSRPSLSAWTKTWGEGSALAEAWLKASGL
ncbi:hypothetical protein QYE76_029660 [Lolium multiflorum]|uniref:Transposase (putative) gypsy type domain-containing protein n=1 Tax=Lolium multiflorum TaxID=4521 RepID=A0AAD8VFR0_LOLMU|nr:hypothetical protein QYE76_029660 [Lolium multiflorum]